MTELVQSSSCHFDNFRTLVPFQVFTQELVRVLLVHLLQVQHILVLLNQLLHGWRMSILI